MEFIHHFFSPNTTSEQWRLNITDYARSIVQAIFTGVVTMAGESMSKGMFVFDWKTIWHTALYSAIAYLGKNLLTPAAPKA